ncbi:permease-like cell division protein FtsX [Agrilutibacter solisilvae]|uniref:Cell division protein FtsX n=1 Tax=Agrilutibacter solisilvae TaxID=2763317 RepID=A0A974Y115_9GAMM|nr:permease-like cell division protein FtsX [Lysobacter solisilvae]QSX79349.1 ABC transporter permease [Lysobacter solisilvae]
MNTEAAPRPSPLRTWLDHHGYSVVASLGRLLRRPGATLITVGVFAVALALPLGLWASLANIARLAGSVQQAQEISVFLRPEVPVERARVVADSLRTRRDVAALQVRTPAQGLEDLRASGLEEALAALPGNPLPSVLVVTPRGAPEALVAALEALPESEHVVHDAQWRERLQRWLQLGMRLGWVLAGLLGLGGLLVIGSAVRADIQARREEIGVLQLLGASDGFIRRPFLYLGAAYGLLGGALALGLLTAADLALREPLAALSGSYGGRFALQGFGPLHAAAIVAGAGLLGWLGAGLVTGHYLRQTRPTET